jgi:hypothetical protein
MPTRSFLPTAIFSLLKFRSTRITAAAQALDAPLIRDAGYLSP